MMQTIFLKEEECYCPLDKFYANVAKHLGYDVPYDDLENGRNKSGWLYSIMP